uniref:RNase H-like domain-containing protein n=1 Tax=Litorimonas sp. TaxID=1892381 RepID=UPI003A84E045
LEESNIIKKVSEPTRWCAPSHFVTKKVKDKLRLVTDYTSLNKNVSRPNCPFPSPAELVKRIPHGTKVYATLDALHGYFQRRLSEESSFLTTFLTEWGRFRYLACPMGMVSSGDLFIEAMNDILESLFEWCLLEVDDILVCAESLEQLEERLNIIFERCRERGLQLSKAKFVIGSTVEFAGFLIDEEGVKPLPSKIEALTQFHVPTDVSCLKSFLGLVQIFTKWHPDLSQQGVLLRTLLKQRNAWVWTEDHQKEFDQLKMSCAAYVGLKPFDPSLPLVLITDASRIFGLGFILYQPTGSGSANVLQCGSSALNDAQKNYAVIELECLAIAWALDKTKFFTRGTLTHIKTDHQPLLGIFKKQIRDVGSRLQRIRRQLAGFNLSLSYLEGKNNKVADCLSRNPVWRFSESEKDVLHFDNMEFAVNKIDTNKSNMNLVREARNDDKDYLDAIVAMKNGLTISDLKKDNKLHDFQSKWDYLSIVNDADETEYICYGEAIFAPQGARKKIIDNYHRSHQGHVKMMQTAKSEFYWPTINCDILNKTKGCDTCLVHSDSKPRHPLKCEERNDMNNSVPMQSVFMDFGKCQGKDYIFACDQFSGYLFIIEMRSTTASATSKALDKLFEQVGRPGTICSDGGPPFRSKEFRDFLSTRNISQRLSSPRYPESNGIAENSVKQGKRLLIKCVENKEDISSKLFHFNNVIRAGFTQSPGDMFHQRKLNTDFSNFLPKEHDHQKAVVEREEAREKAINNDSKNVNPKSNEEFHIGAKVRLQNYRTGLWDLKGLIVKRLSHTTMDVMVPDSGKVYTRNVKFIKPEIVSRNVKLSGNVEECEDNEFDGKSQEVTQQREPVQRRVRFQLQPPVCSQPTDKPLPNSHDSLLRQGIRPVAVPPATLHSSARLSRREDGGWERGK